MFRKEFQDSEHSRTNLSSFLGNVDCDLLLVLVVLACLILCFFANILKRQKHMRSVICLFSFLMGLDSGSFHT